MKVFTKTNRSKLLSPVSIMTWILIVLMMFSSLTSVIAETSEGNKTTTMVFIIDSSTYVVNGEPIVMDVSPTIIENRTMLPIRYAAEPLGADIEWDGVERKATISLGATKLELWIGQSNALINGKTVPIDADNANVKPLIVSNRTMLPLRFVTENLGCDIEWDPVARKATITKTGSSSGIIGKIPDISIIDPGIISDIKLPGIDLGNITLKPDLKSDDITVLKSTWAKDTKGKEYPVTLSEADIPVVMRIGCGYDVFGKYASVDSLKQQVLDTQKLIQNQRMARIYYDDYGATSIVERSIKEYSESMSVSARAGGSFMGFGGSVSTNFAKGFTEKTDQYFATHSHIKKVYGVYVKTPTADTLKAYLTDDAKEWINNKNISAADLFGNFGQYVLVDTITGGRVDYSITADSTASTSFENFSIAAKASFKVAVFGASASTEYQKIKNEKEYSENKDTQFRRYGGSALYEVNLSNPQALIDWENSLESRGTLVDFGEKTKQALIPIWEFCNDSIRKTYLKDEFDKLNLAEGNKWPAETYIKRITPVMHTDEKAARLLCNYGDYLIDVNLNEGTLSKFFIFLTYTLTKNSDDAYTDFFIEFSDKELDGVTQWMTHNGNAAIYTRIPHNLSTGVLDSSDFFNKSKPIFVYLWTTKDKTLPPIKKIEVVLDDPESAYPGWNVVYEQNSQKPANINKEAIFPPGKALYIKFQR